MIAINDLHLNLAGSDILSAISLRVERGEMLSLLGPSGCGKTTLLRIIAGLQEHQSGSLTLDDQTLSHNGTITVPAAKRDVAFLFQDFTLFPHMSAEQNITIALTKMGAAQRRERLQKVVDMLQIGKLLPRRIDSLSGGEQQRIALARTLAMRPKVVLLDEPFSNLDKMTKKRIYHEVRDLLKREGITGILTTHDQEEAFFFGDKLVIMRKGEILAQGDPHQLYAQPASEWLAHFTGEANCISGESIATAFANSNDFNLEPSATYLVRPEDIMLSRDTAAATILEKSFYGTYTELKLGHNAMATPLIAHSYNPLQLQSGEGVTLTLATAPWKIEP